MSDDKVDACVVCFDDTTGDIGVGLQKAGDLDENDILIFGPDEAEELILLLQKTIEASRAVKRRIAERRLLS